MKSDASSARASRTLARLWLVCVAALATGLGLRLAGGLRLETSVLAMLPRDERDPTLHELAGQLQGRAARTLLVLVGHVDPERTAALARELEGALRSSPAFESVAGAVDSERERAFHQLYFPRRFAVLAPAVRRELEGPRALERAAERVLGRLSSPMSSAFTSLLGDDPLLYFPELLASWSSAASAGLGEGGFPTVRDSERSYAVLAATTTSDPFDARGQRDALDIVEHLARDITHADQAARVLWTGVPRFAVRARERMQSEMSWIGAASTLGTALCVLLVLGSWRPLALSLVAVAIAAAAGTWACIELFPDVHFLTLVFGTSLTGMGVDYALHYFCVHRRAGADWDPQRGMRTILPGITVGMLTSVVGFSGLFFTPFPVLQQFAVFSSVGLFAAWATVVAWFPAWSRAPYAGARRSWFDAPNNALLAVWARWNRRRATGWIVLGAALLAAGAAARLAFVDDVRRFQALPEDLVAEDRAVRELAGRTDEGRFVLVEGASEQQVLERLEACVAKLDSAVEQGALSGTTSLAPFLPSARRQAQDAALVRAKLLEPFDELRASLDAIGFEDDVATELRAALEAPAPPALDAETFFASPATEFLRPLWLGQSVRGWATSVLLRDVTDGERIERALAGLDGVHYVDRVRDLSRLMGRYRSDALRLVGLAYAIVLATLCLRFGPARGLRVFAPAALASALTLLALAACGAELTLFHLLGLLLVLGLAVDYGTFLAESDVEGATTMLALSLSAVTTIVAFGLMMFSSAPPLVAIGSSVSLGIALSLLLAPSAWTAEER